MVSLEMKTCINIKIVTLHWNSSWEYLAIEYLLSLTCFKTQHLNPQTMSLDFVCRNSKQIISMPLRNVWKNLVIALFFFKIFKQWKVVWIFFFRKSVTNIYGELQTKGWFVSPALLTKWFTDVNLEVLHLYLLTAQ